MGWVIDATFHEFKMAAVNSRQDLAFRADLGCRSKRSRHTGPLDAYATVAGRFARDRTGKIGEIC
jgi:hypothetical protein